MGVERGQEGGTPIWDFSALFLTYMYIMYMYVMCICIIYVIYTEYPCTG